MAKHGYFKVSRKSFKPTEEGGCPFYNEDREFSRWEAWLDIIALAAYSDHQQVVGGSVVELERGEFCASCRFLARRWGWSKSRVHRFLNLLECMDRITSQNRDGRRDTYLVENYDSYQGERDGRRDKRGTSAGQARDKEKEGRKKGERREKELTALCSEPDRPASEPQPEVLLEFPVTGNGGSGTWGLTTEKLEEYLETYPAADERSVLTELRKARQWCRDNPGRRKTLRGMPRFLSNWLAKAQDRGGIGKPASGRSSGPRTSSGGHWPYPDAKDDF